MSEAVVKFPRKGRARKPAAGTLACPAHVVGIAREEWDRVVAATKAARILTAENGALLEAYCIAYARWRAAEAHLALHGPIVPTPRTGAPMHSPMATVAAKERDAMMRLADVLGLTPRARGQIEAAKDADDNGGWEGLLA